MAKPILIIKLPIKTNLEHSEKAKIASSVKKDLKGEYHIIIASLDVTGVEFECVNDCKGLKDVDIKKLINKYYYENQTKESKEA